MSERPEQEPRRESPVCPYCGMTTWYDGHCALPGCEGHEPPQPPFLNVGEGEYGMGENR